MHLLQRKAHTIHMVVWDRCTVRYTWSRNCKSGQGSAASFSQLLPIHHLNITCQVVQHSISTGRTSGSSMGVEVLFLYCFAKSDSTRICGVLKYNATWLQNQCLNYLIFHKRVLEDSRVEFLLIFSCSSESPIGQVSGTEPGTEPGGRWKRLAAYNSTCLLLPTHFESKLHPQPQLQLQLHIQL